MADFRRTPGDLWHPRFRDLTLVPELLSSSRQLNDITGHA